MEKNKYKTFLYIFIALIILGLQFYNFFLFEERRETENNLLKASQDSLFIWKNKHGQQMARIKVLESSNIENLLLLETTNETINELKNLVKENKKLLKERGSATIIKTTTKIDTTVVTIVETDTITGFPIYRSKIENKWYNIKSVASKDSTQHLFKTFSELNIIVGQEKQKGLKKSIPYAIANDKNPYTNIKDMRVYQVSLPKQKRLNFGIYTGYGINLNNKISTGVQFGVGLNYNIISIK